MNKPYIILDEAFNDVKCEELNATPNENKIDISTKSLLSINKDPESDTESSEILETKVEICEIPDFLKLDEDLNIRIVYFN